MKKLLKFLNGYRIKTIIGPIFKLIEAVFELIVPLIVAYMIDEGIPKGRGGDFTPLITGGVWIVALSLLGLGFSLTAQFFASRASLGFGTNLRHAMYKHISGFSYSDYDKFSSSTLTTRLTSDTYQTQNAVAMFIRLVTRVPFIIIGATIMAITIDFKLSLIFIISGIIVGVVPFILMNITSPQYKAIQKSLDEVTQKTRENLTGARVVRAFNAEKREYNEFTKTSDGLAKKSIRTNIISSIFNPFSYAIINIAIVCILYFGSKQVYYGDLSQGQIIALINYLTQIMHTLVVFANLFVTFSKASASAVRINEVLDTVPAHSYGVGAELDNLSPLLSVENVSFTYDDDGENELENISFTLNKGQTLGIIGGTGSGKTTLINLLLNNYPLTEGNIKIKGADVKKLSANQMFDVFSLAEQKAQLFSGTIKENLLMAKPDATDEEIIQALKSAQAYEFIKKTEKGIDTEVSANGKNFSGGQQQRISLARAFLKSCDILILDDSSSALDFATDLKLRRAIKKLPYSPAVITVSQRAATLQNSDNIIVLDNGHMVGVGTHSQLIETCDVYREIYNSQVKEA